MKQKDNGFPHAPRSSPERRYITLFLLNFATCQICGRHILSFLDGYMKSSARFAFDRSTIGEFACYPYVVMAPQGDVPLDE